jgi:hypothetical protein
MQDEETGFIDFVYSKLDKRAIDRTEINNGIRTLYFKSNN